MMLHPLTPPLQRSDGSAHVALVRRGQRITPERLYQRGSAKAILPRIHDIPEVVFLNTSGGLTGGDRLHWRLDLGPGLRAVATSQTAERAYRSTSGPAEVGIDLTVAEGAWLDWLPQETILYDGCHLSRRTRVDLEANAGCLLLEIIVLGRRAMGETVSTLRFRDWREIRRCGQYVMLEPLGLNAPTLEAGPAVLDGALAFASLVMVCPEAADALDPLRTVLDEPGVISGASAFDGRLTCRMRARDGWPLRRQVIRALSVLRRAPLPRNWQTLERQR